MIKIYLPSKPHLKTVYKIDKIFDAFYLKQEELGVSEISRIVGFNKSIVYRILFSLTQKGYIIQNKSNKKYFLGLKLFQLGNIALKKMNVRFLALPIMEKIVVETQESVYLYLLNQDKRICIEKIESPHDIRFILNLGETLPLYCEAAGKSILAFLPSSLIEKVIKDSKLIPLGPNTITDPNKLKEELLKIRKEGYALSIEERVVDSFSVAAPIFNHEGRVVSSLSVAGPLGRFSNEKFENIKKIVLFYTKKLSSELGYMEEK